MPSDGSVIIEYSPSEDRSHRNTTVVLKPRCSEDVTVSWIIKRKNVGKKYLRMKKTKFFMKG